MNETSKAESEIEFELYQLLELVNKFIAPDLLKKSLLYHSYYSQYKAIIPEEPKFISRNKIESMRKVRAVYDMAKSKNTKKALKQLLYKYYNKPEDIVSIELKENDKYVEKDEDIISFELGTIIVNGEEITIYSLL